MYEVAVYTVDHTGEEWEQQIYAVYRGSNLVAVCWPEGGVSYWPGEEAGVPAPAGRMLQ